MASLRKRADTQYWFACFTLPDGRRVQRSTKETKRKEAQKVADEFEQLSKSKAKARQAHKVIADIYKSAHASSLPDATVERFLNGWIARRKGEVAPATHAVYSRTVTVFLDFLGDDKEMPLAEIETAHIVAFRDLEATRLAVNTVNGYIKHLRIFLEDARRDGFIAENPAKDCHRLKRGANNESNKRRPFTIDEIKKVLAVADNEMRSLILFGLYTGQRQGDLAKLTWSNIDLVGSEIQITTNKTGRVVRIPMTEPLQAHIEALPTSDDPNECIHPRAANCRPSTNSIRFYDLLHAAGLVPRRSRGKSTRTDDSKRRAPSLLSFHSLRHTATSLMKNAGVSPAVVQDIIGHESAAISASYTHIEKSAKSEALNNLPNLL